MQNKKVPMRMCTGCGQMKPKKELVRVVKTPEDEILIDLTGKKNGRGAYICKDLKCLRKARKSKRIEKGFSCHIADQVYDSMEEQLSDIQ
ncbi:MAG: YlxR family protein [Oscillospiraceae bacterium]